jgi:hypothetical protein
MPAPYFPQGKQSPLWYAGLILSSDDEATEHGGRGAWDQRPAAAQQPAITSNSNNSRHGSAPGSHGASPLGQHHPPRIPPGTAQSMQQPPAGRSTPPGGASGHSDLPGSSLQQNPTAGKAANGKMPDQPIKAVGARQYLHPCRRTSYSYLTCMSH